MMERLMTIIRKEFIHIMRDPRTLALIIALPTVLLVLLGYGVSGEATNSALAVADFSRSDASRRYIEYFTAGDQYQVAYEVLSEQELIRLIDEDKVVAGLWIPEDFGRNLDTGHPAHVQFYLNGADPAISQTHSLKLSTIGQVAIQEIFSEQLSQSASFSEIALPIEMHMKTLYNPDGDSSYYMIPGLLAMVLEVQALLLTALAIVREREQGTMEQLIVTPIKSWELMLGKIVPYLLVGMFNTVVTLIVAVYLFEIQIAGSFWLLLLLSMVFVLGTLGLGVLVSNLSRTQMQAMYLAVGIVLIPSIILSGLMFSREGMPWITFAISEVLPVTHYLDIIRGIMVKGTGVEFLWPAIIPLVILSIVYFVASVFAFRKEI
jgi:ABC-2 type transport system permease protein